MNYYLDVDGTIITRDHQQAHGLQGFLTHLTRTGDVFWLTTHCRYADTSSVLANLKPILTQENYCLVSRFKPAIWNTLKTEALDFSHPFLWFDDYLLEIEKKILEDKNCFQNWIMINLEQNDRSIMQAVSCSLPDFFN